MSGRLITLHSFGTPQEAELVRALLESYGITAFVTDDNIARLTYTTPFGGVKVQVSEDDLDEAREILQNALLESETAADDRVAVLSDEFSEETQPDSDMAVDDAVAEPSCPICGGQRSQPVADPMRSVLGVLLLGMPFLVWRGKRRCDICGNVWRG